MKTICYSLLLAMVMCVSCSKHTAKSKSFPELVHSIVYAANDSTITSFSDSTYEEVEMLMDSLYAVTKSSLDPDSILFARSLGLQLPEMVMKKCISGGKERAEGFLDRLMHIQFEFQELENDSLVMFNLMNVFVPQHHESYYGVGDYYDFFVYVNKNTGKCVRMVCILPTFYDQEKTAPNFYVFTKKNMSEPNDIIDGFNVKYEEDDHCWKAVSDGRDLDKLLQNDQLFFFSTMNGEDHESSCINLSCFHDQYKKRFK